MLHLSHAGRSWWIAVACTTLALLAMGIRLRLLPATVSYLLLAVGLWLVRPRGRDALLENGEAARYALPSWPLLILFVLWVNTDQLFLVGLATLSLLWLG